MTFDVPDRHPEPPSQGNDSGEPIRLRMEYITKHFGGVHALENVHFEARRGEIHALCGENGAGKSTLMSILAGAITEYAGRIELEGRERRFSGPRDAEDAGIRIIHQELNLVPDLTVAANIFLGRERRGRLGWIDDRAMVEEARRLFARLGAPIDPRARLGDLRIGDQQMVEIARALAFDASILIMDEPTSALSDAEVTRLHRVIRELRDAGTSVLYISHKMNEVFALGDRITVLRDGRFVASARREETRPEQVIRWMVGREIASLHLETTDHHGSAILEVEELSVESPPARVGRPSLRGISFQLRRGEVLGVAGLLGAGRTELLEAIFGAGSGRQSGSIRLDGHAVRFRHPAEAIAAGVALVTEDRKQLGLFDRMTVGENITMAHLSALARLGVIRKSAERRAVAHAIERHRIKSSGGQAPITSLSGGNQQKCILARWLLSSPRVLLLDEPTRGIDVGAKAEIYTLIRELAIHEGMGILMTSSELTELLAVCDRILVLCEGRLTGQQSRAEATEETIMELATRFRERSRDAS